MKKKAIGQLISHLLPSFNFTKWIEGEISRQKQAIVIDGLDYTMEILPVYITGESNETLLASAVMSIHPTTTSSAPEVLADSNSLGFEHFVGVSNRHKALMSQAKKASYVRPTTTD